MAPISATLPRLTRKMIGKRGFAEGGLLEDWTNIVGQELSAQCIPVKLSYPPQGIRNDGTLLLKADPAFALTIQQQAPQIIERINSHFGYRAVARLSLQQAPLPQKKTPQKPQLPKLSPTERQSIAREFSNIQNESLRAALEELATTLKAKQKTPK
ncbi:DUF721 domain-containing protein [Kiloniella laminariae]|uniref:DUF721 domain-containing protein n=1 Tax=Kiloniella laminariae TaxID=454162 RepID=UPI0003765320|nr:DciA family protein [Kiloniella laminariae]